MEGTLFTIAQYQTPEITPEQYSAFLVGNFGPTVAKMIEQYYKLSLPAFNSTPFPAFYAISTIVTDYGYKCPAYRGLNRAVANGIPVWTYLFDHTPSCIWVPALGSNPQVLELLGPTHTSEIPYVFGNVKFGNCSFDAVEQTISASLIDQWSSMAADAHPTSEWPEYFINGSMGLNIINSTSAGVVDYSVCKLWDEIDAAMLAETVEISAANATSIVASEFKLTNSANSSSTTISGSAVGVFPSSTSTANPVAYTGSAAKLAGNVIYAVMGAATLGAILLL